MKVANLNDYSGIEAKRPMQRRIEQMLRAEASRLHKRRTLKTLMKTGFRIRRVNVASKYMKTSNELVENACNIYLAHYLTKQKAGGSDLTRDELFEEGFKKFENLDPDTLSYYLSAALLDSPGSKTPVASSAYHSFLAMHVSKARRKAPSADRNSSVVGERIIKEGRKFWNKMRPHQKFPFFLLAYMNSFYPRELDGSVAATVNALSRREIRQTLRNAEKTIKELDAGKAIDPAKLPAKKKKVQFGKKDSKEKKNGASNGKKNGASEEKKNGASKEKKNGASEEKENGASKEKKNGASKEKKNGAKKDDSDNLIDF